MVILGIGSNEGHRLGYCRQALQALKAHPEIQVIATSPLYQSDALMPDDAPAHWNKPYLNGAVHIAFQGTPGELIILIKQIEASIGRRQVAHWAPRVIDIDLLCWHDAVIQEKHLTVPHAGLCTRPFALWPLLDLQPDWINPTPGPQQDQPGKQMAAPWGSPWTGHDAPFRTRRVWQRIDTPALMGIMNITPDSFSDGSPHMTVAEQLQKAEQLVSDGAEVLDIGAESTRPGATPISADEEWQRLAPLLAALHDHPWAHPALKPLISIDSYHLETMHRALDWGADWINDVSGELCQYANLAKDRRWVCMRPSSAPITQTGLKAVEQCMAWMQNKLDALDKLGINREQIILDPGIGFGCPAQASMAIVNHCDQLKILGVPILIGHSRKSFLQTDSPLAAKDRDNATLSISTQCCQKMHVLRLHQIKNHSEYWALQHQYDQAGSLNAYRVD